MKQLTKQKQERERRVTSSRDALCKELLRLTRDLHKFEARVEFLRLAFRYNVADEIINYEIWDLGFEGVGERQFDTCFEMGDSQDVIAQLIRHARAEAFIENVQIWCGQESFEKWVSYADRQGELF